MSAACAPNATAPIITAASKNLRIATPIDSTNLALISPVNLNQWLYRGLRLVGLLPKNCAECDAKQNGAEKLRTVCNR